MWSRRPRGTTRTGRDPMGRWRSDPRHRSSCTRPWRWRPGPRWSTRQCTLCTTTAATRPSSFRPHTGCMAQCRPWHRTSPPCRWPCTRLRCWSRLWRWRCRRGRTCMCRRPCPHSCRRGTPCTCRPPAGTQRHTRNTPPRSWRPCWGWCDRAGTMCMSPSARRWRSFRQHMGSTAARRPARRTLQDTPGRMPRTTWSRRTAWRCQRGTTHTRSVGPRWSRCRPRTGCRGPGRRRRHGFRPGRCRGRWWRRRWRWSVRWGTGSTTTSRTRGRRTPRGSCCMAPHHHCRSSPPHRWPRTTTTRWPPCRPSTRQTGSSHSRRRQSSPDSCPWRTGCRGPRPRSRSSRRSTLGRRCSTTVLHWGWTARQDSWCTQTGPTVSGSCPWRTGSRETAPWS
mmetsp:Transcript_51952/g.112878  ORF Transcript_51952/g.112878 Transcript_51952/m.112878 type:complete len:393 (+) Transcript_51952:806-1984(+)